MKIHYFLFLSKMGSDYECNSIQSFSPPNSKQISVKVVNIFPHQCKLEEKVIKICLVTNMAYVRYLIVEHHKNTPKIRNVVNCRFNSCADQKRFPIKTKKWSKFCLHVYCYTL